MPPVRCLIDDHVGRINDNVAGEVAIHRIGSRCIQFGVPLAKLDGLWVSTSQGDNRLAGVDDPDRAGFLFGGVTGGVGYLVGDRVIPDSVGVHCTTVNDNAAGEVAIHRIGRRCIQFGVSHAEMDGLRIITSQGDNRLAGVDDPDRARHGIGFVTGGVGYIIGYICGLPRHQQ